MRDLVRRARRRLFHDQLLVRSANSLSAAVGALILLLLAGAGTLGWYWAVVALAAAAIAGIWQARRRLPSPYRAAQLVDARLDLADTLSTAVHFSAAGIGTEIERRQQEQAEQLAATVDLRRAIPYVLPRSAYLLAALALVACGICALRYGLTRRLDFKPSLARLIAQRLDPAAELASNPTAPAPAAKPDDPLDPAAQQGQPGAGEPAQASSLDSQNPSAPAAAERHASENGGPQQGQNAEAQNGEPGEQAGSSDAAGGNRQPPTAQNAQREPAPNENASLLSKAKDALQNLLSRALARRQNSDGAPSSGSNRQANPPRNQAQSNQPRQGQSGQPGDEADSQPQEAPADGQPGQAKPGKSSNGEQAGKQPGSGAGSNEGDKSLRQAEQLAAMGKISRIIGKRSANVTGEAVIEVESTAQQLRTPYAPGGARHTQGGAEINRDEIPVALEGYVEQYFEQVRKQAAAKK